MNFTANSKPSHKKSSTESNFMRSPQSRTSLDSNVELVKIDRNAIFPQAKPQKTPTRDEGFEYYDNRLEAKDNFRLQCACEQPQDKNFDLNMAHYSAEIYRLASQDDKILDHTIRARNRFSAAQAHVGFHSKKEYQKQDRQRHIIDKLQETSSLTYRLIPPELGHFSSLTRSFTPEDWKRVHPMLDLCYAMIYENVTINAEDIGLYNDYNENELRNLIANLNEVAVVGKETGDEPSHEAVRESILEEMDESILESVQGALSEVTSETDLISIHSHGLIDSASLQAFLADLTQIIMALVVVLLMTYALLYFCTPSKLHSQKRAVRASKVKGQGKIKKGGGGGGGKKTGGGKKA